MSYLLSLLCGTLGGLAYGTLFLIQKKDLFTRHENNAATNHRARLCMHHLTRFAPLLLLWCYVLLSPIIHHILLILSFFCMFWLVILKKA